MRRFIVIGLTPQGRVQHIIHASCRQEAKDRFRAAHPDALSLRAVEARK